MEVTNNTNNYQTLATTQKNSIQALPEEPKYTNGEIYEASQGNLIRKDGEITLTPQGEVNRNNAKENTETEEDAITQAQKDQQRAAGTDYLAQKSMQSQVEIYLAVATDNKVELGNNDTASIIESLRDVQKQNNAVEAYATYKENQDPQLLQ